MRRILVDNEGKKFIVTATRSGSIIKFIAKGPEKTFVITATNSGKSSIVRVSKLVSIIDETGDTEEQLIGEINGSNKVFNTSQPFIPGTTKVYINGLRQERDTAYEETDEDEITFSEAPLNAGFTDFLLINYRAKLS